MQIKPLKIPDDVRAFLVSVQTEIDKVMTAPVYYPALTAREKSEWYHRQLLATEQMRRLQAEVVRLVNLATPFRGVLPK